MSLLEKRITYKPFSYNQAYDYWLKQQQSHWIPTEVQMASDVQDWKLNLTESEKSVIAGVLKGFIQTELIVEDYWATRVAKWFPHPEIQMMASTFGSFECFDKETELLTATGWKNVTTLSMNDKIAQYDIKSKKITFVNPLKVVSYDYNGKLHYYNSSTTNICVTPNHDLVLIHPKTKKAQKKKSMEGKWGRNYLYPIAGIGDGKQDTLSAYEKLLIAVQADGTLRGLCPQSNKTWKTCDINLKKERKIKRLESLLKQSKIEFSKRITEDGFTLFTFCLQNQTDINLVKSFECFNLSDFSVEKAKEFIEELIFWDGSANRLWYNTNKQAVDFVQAIAVLGNISAQVSMNRTKEESLKNKLPQGTTPKTAKDCFVISFSDQVNRTYPHRVEVDYNDKVYCVSVPTQNIISRRNNKVAITGNTIHTVAYAYLNDTLGLTDYDAFLQEPTAKAKIDRLINIDPQSTDLKEIAASLAIFSAFTEGVSLFSSFAILFNFSRFNKLKGVSQIISWSVLDESLHSQAGTWLFRTLIQENPEIWTDDVKQKIYEAARETIKLEDNFIDMVFKDGEIEGVNTHDLKQFIRHRANVKLGEVLCKTNWKNIDQDSLKRMAWFDTLSQGIAQQDFFSGREFSYGKGVVDFGKIFQDD
jgi:ribonucleotide reductase beta subunit family protein with ferritin-like domain